MAGVYPFPGNPNQTGANMPPGLAVTPPRSGAGPTIPAPTPSSPFSRPTGPENAVFEAPSFAAPPGTRPAGQAVPPQPSGSWGEVPTGTASTQQPTAPPSQPPATPSTPQLAPWYWRYPVGAYMLAARMPWWFWLGAGVATGVGGTIVVQRRRRRRVTS